MLYPYEPKLHTPKLVIMKNMQAPASAPKTLFKIFLFKCLDNKPMNTMLPQVKKTVE